MCTASRRARASSSFWHARSGRPFSAWRGRRLSAASQVRLRLSARLTSLHRARRLFSAAGHLSVVAKIVTSRARERNLSTRAARDFSAIAARVYKLLVETIIRGFWFDDVAWRDRVADRTEGLFVFRWGFIFHRMPCASVGGYSK